MNILEIKEILPHRYPFLLVDKILEIEIPKRIVGLKNVSINEPFFTGHFPDFPIFPGVLMLEAIAQVGGILVLKTLKVDRKDYVVLYSGVEKAKFKKPVFPGDTMIIEVNLLSLRLNFAKMEGVIKVNNEIRATATIYASAIEKNKFLKNV
jgi:3-hydroxyacyl-[acyl-carrier-protein] dehydratase